VPRIGLVMDGHVFTAMEKTLPISGKVVIYIYLFYFVKKKYFEFKKKIFFLFDFFKKIK
jgi:hypothetical protein